MPSTPRRTPRIAARAPLSTFLASAAILTATGCQSTTFQSGPGGRAVIVEGFAPNEPLLIDSPPAIPAGWELAQPGDPPLAGDAVTLLIVIQHGDNRSVHYLDIELLNEPGDQYALVAKAEGTPEVRIEPWEFLATRNTLLDEQGRTITESRGSVAYSLLTNGPYDLLEGYAISNERQERDPAALESARALGRTSLLSDDELRASMRGVLSFIAFGYGVRDDGVMRRLIQPLFTFRQGLLLLAAGFETEIDIDESSVQRAGTTSLAAGLTINSNRGAVELAFGTTPVLRAQAIAIRPVAPLGLAGGIVRLDAHNLGQPTTRVLVQPIAARRGKTWPTLSRLTIQRNSTEDIRFMRMYLSQQGEWIEGPLIQSDYEWLGIDPEQADTSPPSAG